MSANPEKASRRPLYILLMLLAAFVLFHAGLYIHSRIRVAENVDNVYLWQIATSTLGLSDLCIATEARYTRHPAVSDAVVPFMDHPGAIEHFPTGSFWAPPTLAAGPENEQ